MEGEIKNMLDELFDRPGTKLLHFIKSAFVCGTILSMVLGIVLGIMKGDFFLFLKISIGVPVSIWVSSLFIITLLNAMTDIRVIRLQLQEISETIKADETNS